MTSSLLIFPGNPLYDETLGRNLPPDRKYSSHYVSRSDSGLLEAVDDKQLREYLEGGEYEERLAQHDDPEFIDIWVDL